MKKQILTRFLSAAALGMVLASPAYAQGTAASPAAEEPEDGIRDIIVTAQRREQNIQSVPVAVTAIDAQALSQSSVKDIRDFAGKVPGLVVDQITAGPRAAGIAIRGISFEDIEKSFDPAVGVVVDGVYLGTNTGALMDVFDLESMEVLRGPQGTLFGRNTIGGVINIKRSAPTDDFGVKASMGYAEFNTWRGRAVINTGKIGDSVALKGFVSWDKTDGYYRNVTQNRTQGKYETLNTGITAKITPSSDLTLTLTYEHMRERGETVTSSLNATPTAATAPVADLLCLRVPVGGGVFVRAYGIPDVQCDREALGPSGLYTTFTNKTGPVFNDGDNIFAEAKLKLGNFNLVSVTGYQQNKEDVSQDFDGTSVDFFFVSRQQKYKQFSQEFRLVGDIAQDVNLLLGAYYFNSSYQMKQSTDFGANIAAAGAPAFNLSAFVDHNSKSYAGFADIQAKLSDKLKVGVGARYTEDKKAIFNNYGQIAALVQLSVPGWTNQCVQAVGLLAPGVPRYAAANNCTFSKSFGKFTWRAHAEYDLGDRKMAYASFSRGFRSGGFNGRGASVTSVGPYRPETVDAYEIGFKGDWLDRKLRTNIAAFITKYSDKQEEVVQASPPGSANPQETVVKNAATVNIKGIEAEITAQPSRELSFNANFAILDASYDKFLQDINGDNIPDDVSSLTPRRAPKYTLSFGMDYERDLGAGKIALNTNFRVTDKLATCIVPDPIALAAGKVVTERRCISNTRQALDATLSYTVPMGGAEMKFSVYGRNITNNLGVNSVLPVAGLMTFASGRTPRQFGGEVQIKF